MNALKLNPQLIEKIERKIAKKRENTLLNIVVALLTGIGFGLLFGGLL
jgi:hypothetical protein